MLKLLFRSSILTYFKRFFNYCVEIVEFFVQTDFLLFQCAGALTLAPLECRITDADAYPAGQAVRVRYPACKILKPKEILI